MLLLPVSLLLATHAFAQTPPDAPPPPDEPEVEEEEEEEPVTMRATRGGGARAVTASQKRGEAPAYLLAAAYGAYLGGNVGYLVGQAPDSGQTTTTGGEVVDTGDSFNQGAVTLGVLLGGGLGV